MTWVLGKEAGEVGGGGIGEGRGPRLRGWTPRPWTAAERSCWHQCTGWFWYNPGVRDDEGQAPLTLL